MTRFAMLLKLDLILLFRNGIIYVASVITALYVLILQLLPEQNFTTVLTLLILTDPVMLGFMFTGALVLFEKSGNTLQAMSVTPVRPGEYLASKAIALTLITLLASIIMSVAGVGLKFNLLSLTGAVILSSVLFVFVGFTGVSRVKTFNQYFLVIPLFMAPFSLPILNYLGITHTWLWYAIPTQASLVLFNNAFEHGNPLPVWETIYAWFFLIVSVIIAFYYAKRSWNRTING